MASFKTSPACNCCGCPRFARDEFDRDDSTDLGGDWDERSGNFGVIADEMATDVDGMAIHAEVIDPTKTIIRAKAQANQDNAKLGLVFWQDDDNYLLGELEVRDALPSVVRIFSNTTGTITEHAELSGHIFNLGDWADLEICFEEVDDFDNVIRFTTSNGVSEITSEIVVPVSIDPTRGGVLVRNVASGASDPVTGLAKFDNFEMQATAASGDATCEQCACNICSGTPPRYMSVTAGAGLGPLPGCCTKLIHATYILTRSSTCVWDYVGTPDAEGGTISARLSLTSLPGPQQSKLTFEYSYGSPTCGASLVSSVTLPESPTCSDWTLLRLFPEWMPCGGGGAFVTAL